MRGVIYARYSCDKQREESIEGQLRECRQFAKTQGIDIVNEYIDRAYSATTDQRPAFQRMISDSYLDRFVALFAMTNYLAMLPGDFYKRAIKFLDLIDYGHKGDAKRSSALVDIVCESCSFLQVLLYRV